MTDTLTLPQIATMTEVIPSLRNLQYAVACADRQCGEAACIADEALKMYDEAIDTERPYPVRNDLYGHYQFALTVLGDCKRQRDELKAALLAGLQ
jgi:hypothetical protein